MKPTQSFEQRPRSLSFTVAACVFIVLLAYLFSCVPGLEGTTSRRPASRRIPFQLPISTPEEQGMDADLLALAYTRAAVIPSMYSLLVVRHGHLVAEEYFDTQTRTTPMPVASVCKSVLSALVGIALDEGYLVSLDQRMIDFFPEYDVPALDLVVVTTADNFLGDFSNTPWFTESSIFRLIARDVIPAAY